jgi:hypothetical protein
MAERDGAIVTPACMEAPGESTSSGAEARAGPTLGDSAASRKVASSVIIGRLILLFAATAALVAAIVLTQQYDHAATNSTEHYVCPMHPEVVSRVSGDCPICGMALERARGPEKAAFTAKQQRNGVAEVKRRIVTQFVRAPAWLAPDGMVTAVLHRDDLIGVVPAERTLFFRTSAPAEGLSVRLSSEPVVQRDASTVNIRFKAENVASASYDTGWLELAARPRSLLVVPTSSVLYSGEGAYVLATPPGGHTFTRRSVTIGKLLDSGHVADSAGDHLGTIVVLSGLREGERVVARDTFFLDAERRLQAVQGKPPEVVE